MRTRTPALIITFHTTTEAMAAEKFCLEKQLPGRLIPVPRELTAGCGLAFKAPPEAEAAIAEAFGRAGLCWEAMRVISI